MRNPRSTGPLAIQFLDLAESVKCIPNGVQRRNGVWTTVDHAKRLIAVQDADETKAEAIIGCIEGMVMEKLDSHGKGGDLIEPFERQVAILKKLQSVP